MAIAFSAIVPSELRAPANPIAVKGNTLYTRTFRVVVPASTTVATLVIGSLPAGTLVVGAVIDTDTTFGATSTLALSTSESIFVAAAVQTVLGGEQKTIAANKGVAVKSSTIAGLDLNLILAAASSPASEVIVDVTLVLCSIGPVEDARETFDT